MARVAGNIKIVDALGNYEKSDLTKGYSPSDIDENPGATSYYGFLDSDSNWYIQKVTSTAITYTRGTTAYATNWGNRISLTYGLFDSIF